MKSPQGLLQRTALRRCVIDTKMALFIRESKSPFYGWYGPVKLLAEFRVFQTKLQLQSHLGLLKFGSSIYEPHLSESRAPWEIEETECASAGSTIYP